jgi:RyR domain/TrkA-N domain
MSRPERDPESASQEAEPDHHAAIRLAELADHSSEELQRPRWHEHKGHLWLVLTGLALAAVCLALVGKHDESWDSALLDTVRLFPSGYPGHRAVDGSRAYQAAQVLAAIVSVSVTARLLFVLYADRITRLRARRRRGHSVVCGLGDKGARIVRVLLHAGDGPVTCVELAPNSELSTDARARGAIVLEGDGVQRHALRAVATERARRLVCASGNDDVNAAMAAQAMALVAGARRAAPLELFVHIAQPDLAALMRRPSLGSGAARLQVFNVYELWARRMARAVPLLADRGSSIAIVGDTPLARALVIEVTRRWHAIAHDGAATGRLRIAVVDPRADAICDEVGSLYPAIPRCTELAPIAAAAPIDAASIARIHDQGPAIIYICLDTLSARTALALRLRRQFDGTGPSIVVPAAGSEHAPSRLLGEAAGLYSIGPAREGAAKELLRDSSREALAEAAHAAYLAQRALEPASTRGAARPAEVPWEQLSEEYRERNRRHVDGIANLLRLAWLEVAPRLDWDAPIAPLGDGEVETLAELEHLRWCGELQGSGWNYAPERNDEAQHHHLLIAWSELTQADRELDRALVRQWPALLAAAGYELGRSPSRERLAELFNAAYAANGGGGSTAAATALWQQLPEHARAATYASVDDIGVKVALCARSVEMRQGSSAAAPFSGEEVELLAQREHDRWQRERTAAGWRYGAVRDDARLLHPDLVRWESLSEDRRAVDRRLVEAIPGMLAAVGMQLAPPAPQPGDGDGLRRRVLRRISGRAASTPALAGSSSTPHD